MRCERCALSGGGGYEGGDATPGSREFLHLLVLKHLLIRSGTHQTVAFLPIQQFFSTSLRLHRTLDTVSIGAAATSSSTVIEYRDALLQETQLAGHLQQSNLLLAAFWSAHDLQEFVQFHGNLLCSDVIQVHGCYNAFLQGRDSVPGLAKRLVETQIGRIESIELVAVGFCLLLTADGWEQSVGKERTTEKKRCWAR